MDTTCPPSLVPPTTAVRLSFLEAMSEFESEGRAGPEDETMLGRETREFRGSWGDEAGFSRYVDRLVGDARPEVARASHLVPSTTLWWVQHDEYLGRLAIRHHLTEMLLEVGGHIGYDVRPSARRRGHAAQMLRAALPHANDLGIDPALLTCDVDNFASRRVIESNGGVLEDERSGRLRYWVPTAP